MRIAYACPDRGVPVLGAKGASVHVRSVTSALQRRGHDVVLLAARIGSGNTPPDVESIVELPDPLAEAVVERQLRSLGADVVLERYALESGPFRRASRALGLGHVLEVNAPIVLEASRYRGRRDVGAGLERERSTFETADAIVAVSRRLVEYVHQVSPATTVTWVPNGVDVARFAAAQPAPLGLDAGAVVIGFVGSMKPWHGVHDLLDAFGAVLAPGRRAHLVLAGSGPESEAIARRLRADRILVGRARHLGAVPHAQVHGLLRAFDVGVAPYLPADDFYFSPLKVLEYLAAGLPVVYPGLGDLPAMVGNAGVAYPAGDVTGLAAALAALVDDDSRRRVLAAEAIRQGRRWSWDESARALEELLERVQTTAPVR